MENSAHSNTNKNHVGEGNYVNSRHNCQIHSSEAKIYGNTTKETYTNRIVYKK
jgi:hypothetical protein